MLCYVSAACGRWSFCWNRNRFDSNPAITVDSHHFQKKVPQGIAKEEDEKLLQFGLEYRLQGTQFELCYIVFSIRNKPNKFHCDSLWLRSIIFTKFY